MPDNVRTEMSRQKILKAAMKEFGAKGYKDTSTNALCEACGISKGLIFYYFKTKEQLYQECATYCIDEFDRYMKMGFDSHGDLRQKINECCLLRKKYFMEHPDEYHILSEILYRKNFIGIEQIQELRERYSQHTREVLARLLEGVQLNTHITREQCIEWTAIMITTIDNEIENKYQNSGNIKQMLEEQMRQYETLLEVVLYGILGNSQQ